jgi:hypothetical protein
MASAEYYRLQAKVLLSMALATRDPALVARLEAKARAYLAMADQESASTSERFGTLDNSIVPVYRRAPPQGSITDAPIAIV